MERAVRIVKQPVLTHAEHLACSRKFGAAYLGELYVRKAIRAIGAGGAGSEAEDAGLGLLVAGEEQSAAKSACLVVGMCGDAGEAQQAISIKSKASGPLHSCSA